MILRAHSYPWYQISGSLSEASSIFKNCMSKQRRPRSELRRQCSILQSGKTFFCGDWSWNEPAHEIMVLFVLRKLILQTGMRSHPVGLDVSFLVGPFVYFHTSCERTAKALARLRECSDHFYGHFLPSTDSNRAVVSYWRNDVRLVLVKPAQKKCG